MQTKPYTVFYSLMLSGAADGATPLNREYSFTLLQNKYLKIKDVLFYWYDPGTAADPQREYFGSDNPGITANLISIRRGDQLINPYDSELYPGGFAVNDFKINDSNIIFTPQTNNGYPLGIDLKNINFVFPDRVQNDFNIIMTAQNSDGIKPANNALLKVKVILNVYTQNKPFNLE